MKRKEKYRSFKTSGYSSKDNLSRKASIPAIRHEKPAITALIYILLWPFFTCMW